MPPPTIGGVPFTGVPNTEVDPVVGILLVEPPNIEGDPEVAFPIAGVAFPNRDPEGELATAVEDAVFVLTPNKEVVPDVAPPPPNIKLGDFVALLSKIDPVEVEPNVIEEFPPNIDVLVDDGAFAPKTEVVDGVVDILPNTGVLEELLNGIEDVIVAFSKIFVTEVTDVVVGN